MNTDVSVVFVLPHSTYNFMAGTMQWQMPSPAWNLAPILYAWLRGFQALTSSVWHRHNKQMLRSEHIVRPLLGWYSPTYPFQAPNSLTL